LAYLKHCVISNGYETLFVSLDQIYA